jgi:hypothetical protein
MKTLVRIALLMALGAGMALAQSTPQRSPAGTPPTFPQSQQQPQTPPDQTQPGTQPSTPPDQTPQGSQQPSTAPDQTPQQQPSTTDSGSKMPQNDTSAGMASSPNDVENSIETAIKQDPNLASSDVKVKVTDKKVELSGNVSSNDQKKAAEKIAKDNAGGRKVKDHIKVASNNQSNDQSKNPGAYPKQ